MATPRFSSETLKFIERASRQRHPEWLDRNRAEYETHVLDPLTHLVNEVKRQLGLAAKDYHFPKRCLARLKRSTLSAKNYGSLFRDYVSYSASKPSGSRFDKNPNLFFLIYPADEDGDQVLIAGGLYMPSSRQLRSIREAIAKNAAPFERLFASRAFSARFKGGFSDERKSTRVPRGFDPDHRRLDWLKLQGYFVWKSYPKREFASARFPDSVVKDFTQILRLNELLNSAIAGQLDRFDTPKEILNLPDKLAERLAGIQAPRRLMDF